MLSQPQEDGKKIEKISQKRRSLLKRSGVLAGIAAFASAFSLTPFSPAHAKAQSPTSFIEFVPLPNSTAKQYVGTTIASPYYQAFKGQVPNVFTLQEQEAATFQVKTAQTTFVQVIIPLTGGAGPSFPSFYTAIFRSDPHTISSEYSGLMTQKSAQTIHITIKEYHGALVVDADMDVASSALNGSVQTSQGSVALTNATSRSSVLASQGNWFTCMENCLSARGFGTGLLGAAVAICSAACVQFPTPICPVCIDLLGPILGVAAAAEVAFCLGFCS